MNTTRSTRTALRSAIAGAVLAGTVAVAVPTAALAADGGGTAGAPGTASGTTSAASSGPDTAEETARNTGNDTKQDARKGDTGGSRRTVQLKDGKYAVITKLGEGSYKAVVTGPDGFVFATLTASAPSVTLDGGLKVTLDRKTGLITRTTVKSRNGEAARDTATGSTGKAAEKTAQKTAHKTGDHRESGDAGGKTPPKGGVAAGEAPQELPDTDPALIGGALAAAGVLGGAGVLTARRRKDVRR
ncbi:hypothetical protein V7793_22305 [Streptomyces sp. KLMMK]|uniref:hypothetical protein n=1 Tax=Streptomyces sp. KLMMK TaxID=3109353 RepID=UPI00300B7694